MAAQLLTLKPADVLVSPSPSEPWADPQHAAPTEVVVWTHRAEALIAITTVARVLFVSTLGLTDTEAYYVSWARFPSWSYYDHAPMTAWLVGVAEWLVPGPTAARLVPVLCAAAASWMLFHLGSRLFSPRAGFFAALATAISPAYFFIGILVNPEGALAPLWLGFLLLLYGLRDSHETWRPLALGAVLGLAFMSKYTGLLLLPVALAFVAATPSARHWLRRPAFYLGGLVAWVVAMPVVAWNASHDWPTLQLHLVERMSPTQAPDWASRIAHFAVTQAVTFHPLLVPVLIAGLSWSWWNARYDDRFRLLSIASTVPGAFLALVMIRANDAESHWTMVAYLPLAIAAGAWIDQHVSDLHPWIRRYLVSTVALSATLIGVALGYAVNPQFAGSIPGYSPSSDPTNETLGWESLRDTVQAQAAALGPDVVVVTSHNVLCGHLLEALGDAPRVYCVSPTRTAFDYLGRGAPPEGAPVLYVDSDRYTLDPSQLLPNHDCHDVESVEVKRASLSVGHFRVAACTPGEGDLANSSLDRVSVSSSSRHSGRWLPAVRPYPAAALRSAKALSNPICILPCFGCGNDQAIAERGRSGGYPSVTSQFKVQVPLEH